MQVLTAAQQVADAVLSGTEFVALNTAKGVLQAADGTLTAAKVAPAGYARMHAPGSICTHARLPWPTAHAAPLVPMELAAALAMQLLLSKFASS